MPTNTAKPLSSDPEAEKAFQVAEKRLAEVKEIMGVLNNPYFSKESKRIYIEQNFEKIKDDLAFVEQAILTIKQNGVPSEATEKLKILESDLSTHKINYEQLSSEVPKEVSSNKNQPPQENTFTSILKTFHLKEGQDLKKKYDSAFKELKTVLEESTSVLNQLSELDHSSGNYSNYRRWKLILKNRVDDLNPKILKIEQTDFKGDYKKATSLIVKNRESLEFEKELLKLMLAVDGYPKNIANKDRPEIKVVKEKAQAVIDEILAIQKRNRQLIQGEVLIKREVPIKGKVGIKGEVPTKDLIEVLKSTNKLFIDPNHADKYKLEAKAQQRKSVGMRVLGALMMALSVAVLAVGITLAATGIGLIAGVAASVLIFGAGVKFYQTEDNKLHLVDAVNKLADSWKVLNGEVEALLPENPASQASVMEEAQKATSEPVNEIKIQRGSAPNREQLKRQLLDAAQALAKAQMDLIKLISLENKEESDLIPKIIAGLQQMAMTDSDNPNSIDSVLDHISSLVAKLGEELNKNLDLIQTDENQSAVEEIKAKVQILIKDFKGLNSKDALKEKQNLLEAIHTLTDALLVMVSAVKKGVQTPEVLLNSTKENSPDQELTAAINKFNENVNEPKVEVVKNAAEAFKAAQGLTIKLSEGCGALMHEIETKFPKIDELLNNSKSTQIKYMQLAFDFSQRGFLTLCSKLFAMISHELSPTAYQRPLTGRWERVHASVQKELHHSDDTKGTIVDIPKLTSEIPSLEEPEGNREQPSRPGF